MSPVLVVLLIAAAVIALLTRLRVGGVVRYGGGGLTVRARIGRITFRVYPPSEKKEKRVKKEPKQKPASPKKEGEEKGGLEQLRQYLPLLAKAGGRLASRIRIDRLNASLILAGEEDPAAAAVFYGGANAVLGMLLALLEQNFQVKDRRVHTEVDFQRKETSVELEASVSLRIGQLAGLAFYLLGELSRREKQDPAQSQKEAVEHGKQ